jgi:hypothetical protein
LRQGTGFLRRADAWIFTGRRGLDRLPRSPAIPCLLGHCAATRCAVLSTSPCAPGLTPVRRARMARGIAVGVHGQDFDPRAASDGQRAVRRVSESPSNSRPPGGRIALRYLARGPSHIRGRAGHESEAAHEAVCSRIFSSPPAATLGRRRWPTCYGEWERIECCIRSTILMRTWSRREIGLSSLPFATRIGGRPLAATPRSYSVSSLQTFVLKHSAPRAG